MLKKSEKALRFRKAQMVNPLIQSSNLLLSDLRKLAAVTLQKT